jgi:hypothetical protein
MTVSAAVVRPQQTKAAVLLLTALVWVWSPTSAEKSLLATMAADALLLTRLWERKVRCRQSRVQASKHASKGERQYLLWLAWHML